MSKRIIKDEIVLALWVSFATFLALEIFLKYRILQEIYFLSIVIYLFIYSKDFSKLIVKTIYKYFNFLLILIIPTIFGILYFRFDSIGSFINIVNFIFLISIVEYTMVSNKFNHELFLKTYSLLTSVVLMFLTLFYLGGPDWRRTVLGFHPNTVGLWTFTISMTSLIFLDRQLIIWLICNAFALLNSIIISSRTSILLIGINILIAISIKFRRMSIREKCLIASFLLLVAILNFDIFYTTLASVFELDSQTRGLDSGLSGRTERWALAWRLFKENHFLGHGFKTSGIVIGTTIDNAYLAILLDLGIIGAIYISFLIFHILIKISKTGKLIYINKLTLIYTVVFICSLIYGIFEMRYISFGNSFSLLSFISVMFFINHKELNEL